MQNNAESCGRPPPLLWWQNYVLTPSNTARIVLEVIYLVALLWNIVEELVEMFRLKLEKGSFRFYFKQMWNWIDMTSILVQLAAIGLWYDGFDVALLWPPCA